MQLYFVGMSVGIFTFFYVDTSGFTNFEVGSGSSVVGFGYFLVGSVISWWVRLFLVDSVVFWWVRLFFWWVRLFFGGFRWVQVVSRWVRVGSGGFGWVRVGPCFTPYVHGAI